jgi:NAD(P)-dependent dehydrogenase (short-subunit alcohol dehydrogenase family)
MSTTAQEYLKEAPQPQFQEKLPGKQHLMDPQPVDDVLHDGSKYKAAGKLEGKKALITGGDSGIGRSVALLFALEGADVTIAYLPEEEKDADEVRKLLKERAPQCNALFVPLDLRDEKNCVELVRKHVEHHSGLDTLVLNHARQVVKESLAEISAEQWLDTFNTNIHPFFYITKAAISHIPKGGTITMNASVNPFIGHPKLVDYTATKGAIVAFARALSNQLVGEKGIRVNVVAPGPIWTPLIPASMPKESQENFGVTTKIGRPGQPVEVATCFVFLASPDSGFMSGQVLHPNGGTIIN